MSRLNTKLAEKTWFSWNCGAAPTRARQRAPPSAARSPPVQRQGPGVRHAQPGQQRAQRRLAAARRPLQQDAIAARDRQRQVREDRRAPPGVGEREPTRDDEGRPRLGVRRAVGGGGRRPSRGGAGRRGEHDRRLPPGDLGRAQRREGLRQLAEPAVDEQHAAQADREAARTRGDGRQRGRQQRHRRQQPAARHDDGEDSDGPIQRASVARVGAEGRVLLAVAQRRRLLDHQRALTDHPLDQIVRERQPPRRPAPEQAVNRRRQHDHRD